MSAALQLVTPPETAELQTVNASLLERALAIVITDDASFESASLFVADCAAQRRVVQDKFAKPKADAFTAHKSICALERELLDKIEGAEREAKKRLGVYRAEQERRAAEERRRLEEEARRLEEDRILAEAAELDAAGETEAAMEMIAEPIAPPPVKVAPPTPKVAGISFRESWQFEIHDLPALIRHCAAHPEDTNLLTANTVAIRQLVNARKTACNIPGVRVWSEKNVSAGRRG